MILYDIFSTFYFESLKKPPIFFGGEVQKLIFSSKKAVSS